MITVKFLQDYRGVLTNEAYYRAGDEADLLENSANELAERGVVQLPEPETNALDDMPIDDLREIAKKSGIRGYARMKRQTLLERLRGDY